MMIRIMKFIIETKDFGLYIKPTKTRRLFELWGSEFCGDTKTRISIYGFILYFCGVPIS